MSLRQVLLAAVLVSDIAAAQVGTTDILTGRVTGTDGRPLQGARVEAVSVETGVTRSRATDAQGRYTILFLDGGGQYRVTARMLGLSPQTAIVARQADEDRLSHDFTLSPVASILDAVTVTARPAPRAGERPEPGSTERVLNAEQLARLPIDPTDPNVLALLQPGVIGVAATDSTAAGFSVAGQRTDQNLVTLDGLTFGTGTVPQEAVRNTRVITNTYDIARGQFTGGQVATTTRGGTNQRAGSFSYSLRDPHLEFDGDDQATSSLASGFTQHQLSGGLGGPVIRDKLFVFGSYQVRRRVDPLQVLTVLDAATLERLGAHPDSARRFQDIVGSAGIPLTVPGVPGDRLSDNGTLIGRVDWTINDDHSMMVRGNWQGALQNAFRSSALALPSHAGEQRTGGGGAMLTMTSIIGRFINEGRAFIANDSRTTDPYLASPEGRVRVTSSLFDGNLGVSTFEFGGNTAMPTEGITDQLEISNELSWLSGRGTHRYKLGGLVNRTGFSNEAFTNNRGTFIFNSLADLEANQPAEFRRSLRGVARDGGSWNGAIYLGDTWRRSRAFQMTFGARLEGSSYEGRPAYNAAVETAFGRRTDAFPRDVRVSPRLGFTWQLGLDTAPARRGGQGRAAGAGAAGGGGGRGGLGALLGGGRRGDGGGGGAAGGGAGQGLGLPTTIIRGGIGEFRGRAPTQLFQSAIEATGLPTGEQQIVCVGSAVPTPDWGSYLADPSTIPGQCIGQPGPPTSGQRPSVTVFHPEFSTPRSVRSSLGMTRRLNLRYSLNLDYTFALGTSLYGLRDLNLNASEQFSLSDEANRPVFVPANTVVPATGAVSLLASRRVNTFGQVIEATSELRSLTHQVTMAVNGVSARNMIWNVSYTFMRSRDQTGFAVGSFGSGAGGRFGGGGLAVSGGGFGTVGAGDPNAFEWGTSDLERRHSVLGSVTWLARPWIDLTGMLRVTSGQPYTPRVAGDINGDGSRNDRAFVFNPADPLLTDTTIVNGMQRLLASSSDRVRRCLESQLGTIASRNRCRAEWSPTLDLQANLRPRLGRLNRRLTFAVTAINPLTGIDQLLHGADNLRGWGQPNRPDPTLLYVRGFDATNRRFIYQVNERFGDNTATRRAFRTPFMVGLQARFQVGPDRQREMLQGALGALNNRGGPGGLDFRAIVERIAPDPTKMLIAMKDSLKLTSVQVVKLQLVGDTLNARITVLVDSLTARVAAGAADRGADLRAVFQTVQPLLQRGRNDYLAAIESIRGILTPEQWSQLPENFRNPRLPRMPGEGRVPVRPPSL